MKLLIVIPALNEEGNIESIIERSLAAREFLVRESPVTDVEISVVSDGSTDRTVERALHYVDRITLIVFQKNRGYGAAIQEAWSRSDADLLGFLDADGTCDPRFFAALCTTLEKEKADIVLGSRLNADSQMPLVRRAGNVVFATLLTLLSSRSVRDTASGMRVVRRSSLPGLLPLPDGLHFTPAMSARAVLNGELVIREIPMPYHEREGASKLRVGKDGLRFLRSILDAAFLYRPSRPLALGGMLCLAVACVLMIMPVFYYLQHRSVLEWMIYRFVVSHLLGSSGVLLLCASHLCERIVQLTLYDRAREKPGLRERFFSSGWFWPVPVLLAGLGGALVAHSFFELVRTGATYEHWSRFIAMAFFCEVALILLVTRVVDYSLNLIAGQNRYLKAHPALPKPTSHWENRSVSLSLFDRSEEYDAMLQRGIRLSGEDKWFFINGRLNEMKRQLPAGFCPRRILDFGCGIGDTTRRLAELFPRAEVLGIDTAQSALDHAQQKHGSGQIVFRHIDDFPEPDTIDVCYVNGVFHHIEPGERIGVLQRIRRTLVPTGQLAVFENNPWNPGTRMVMNRIPFDREAKPLSFLLARRLLRQAGFASLAPTRFLFYFPRPLARLRVTERWLVRFPLGSQYLVVATK